MMWLIKFVQKRPTDTTIMVVRMLLGMLLISSLYYNLIIQWDSIESNFFWMEVPENALIYIKYFFIAIWVVPLLIWLFNICLLKKKHKKIVQISLWILLFYISSKIIPTDPNKLDVDSLVAFLWIIPLIAWITGKCITTKCLKFKETITKIRV